jgi:hypothetical protein
MRNHPFASVYFSLALILAGCASEVVRSNATLMPTGPGHQSQVRFQSAVHVESSSGYGRDLPAGSIWEFRGSIAQGQVYRRVDGILTVEGAQVHEAFLVLSGDHLVGFYLPVEQAYSPAREAVTVSLIK